MSSGSVFGLASALLVAMTVGRADTEVKPGDLRPGLVVTLHNADGRKPAEVVRLEPTLALSLKPGEAAHPLLQPAGGKLVWRGHLNVLLAGKYRFRAHVLGQFQLRIGGKVVLTGGGKGADPALVEGVTELAAGVPPLRAEFTRTAGPARVELSWEGPDFREEPLPAQVVGHLPSQEGALAAHRQVEQGRFLAEELACARCHLPSATNRGARGLLSRKGPDLSRVGARVRQGWLERWLLAPRKVHPWTAMPDLFGDDEMGRTEAHAVARYLASLGGPLREKREPSPPRVEQARTRGKALFVSAGCVACHGAYGEKGKKDRPFSLFTPSVIYPLAPLGDKTTPGPLADYLRDPLAVAPAGRMPSLLLSAREAEDLAEFLCQATDPAPKPPREPGSAAMLATFRRLGPRPAEVFEFRKLPAEEAWRQLGKRLVAARGCARCHTIAPGGKAVPASPAPASFDDLRDPARAARGCLASTAKVRGRAPDFGLGDKDREALRAFLARGASGAGSPAPAYEARRALRRFDCLACHTRDGVGGLSVPVVEQLRTFEKAENAEAVAPPPLTEIGHKLRTDWLRRVLTAAGRARPWMGLRMPQFGKDNVGILPEALASLDGVAPTAEAPTGRPTREQIEAGRQLIGRNALGCTSCHDLAGIPNPGTRGPDLAGMTRRVRKDWYVRWLHQPQRMQPGTRMPTVFLEGRSLLDTVLGGDAGKQAEAMWQYLSLGDGLPLPPGLEPPRGMTLTAKARPRLIRTFLPEVGARGIAVGFPGGVSLAFDAHQCRLAYAWSGGFIDAAPVWGNRGGNPARPIGKRFWETPPGCPVGVTAGDPPDFLARARDPAYGGRLPEGKILEGPARLRFLGYATDKAGFPTFRYRLQGEGKEFMKVEERLEGRSTDKGVGIVRHFRLGIPARRTAWLFLGDAPEKPRLVSGEKVSGDLAEGVDVSVKKGQTVLLGGVSLSVKAPEGSAWRLRRAAGKWQVLLRVPPVDEERATAVEVILTAGKK
jgi:cbb3-type cytochrome oxidase cytochrome c subunit